MPVPLCFLESSMIYRENALEINKLVGHTKHGAYHHYLVDFIPLKFHKKHYNFEKIRTYFLEKSFFVVPIARRYAVSKTAILSGKNQFGISVEILADNPKN